MRACAGCGRECPQATPWRRNPPPPFTLQVHGDRYPRPPGAPPHEPHRTGYPPDAHAARTRISAAAWLVVRDTHAAEDMFQNVALKAMTGRAQFQNEAALLWWAFIKARREGIDWLRRRQRESVGLDADVLEMLDREWQRAAPGSRRLLPRAGSWTELQPFTWRPVARGYLLAAPPSKPSPRSQATQRSVQVEHGSALLRTPNPWPPRA